MTVTHTNEILITGLCLIRPTYGNQTSQSNKYKKLIKLFKTQSALFNAAEKA